MALICPLCKNSNIINVEKIKSSDLIQLYNNWLKDDISLEFESIEEIGFHHCDDCDLRFFSPMLNGSESFYEKLQQISWYYMDDKSEYGYAAKYIREKDDVLEIGCGKGSFARKIIKHSYLGLEFSRRAIEMATESGIKVKNEMIQEHAKENQLKYDVVCAFQVLEHAKDLNSFIQASILCLKPGGLLIYSVPSYDSFLAFVENSLLDMPPHHLSKWSDKALCNLGELFDLQIIGLEHETLADIHYKWYAEATILKRLKTLLGLKYSLIDTGAYRFSVYLKRIAEKMANVYEKRLVNCIDKPKGHSVTIVYKKC